MPPPLQLALAGRRGSEGKPHALRTARSNHCLHAGNSVVQSTPQASQRMHNSPAKAMPVMTLPPPTPPRWHAPPQQPDNSHNMFTIRTGHLKPHETPHKARSDPYPVRFEASFCDCPFNCCLVESLAPRASRAQVVDCSNINTYYKLILYNPRVDSAPSLRKTNQNRQGGKQRRSMPIERPLIGLELE